jgi:hypothetical protein
MINVCILVVNIPPGQQQTPNPSGTSLSRPWKPRIAPPIRGQLIVRKAYSNARLGGWKKRMLSCNGTDRGFNVTLCESKPTSNWSFFAREFGEL